MRRRGVGGVMRGDGRCKKAASLGRIAHIGPLICCLSLQSSEHHSNLSSLIREFPLGKAETFTAIHDLTYPLCRAETLTSIHDLRVDPHHHESPSRTSHPIHHESPIRTSHPITRAPAEPFAQSPHHHSSHLFHPFPLLSHFTVSPCKVNILNDFTCTLTPRYLTRFCPSGVRIAYIVHFAISRSRSTSPKSRVAQSKLHFHCHSIYQSHPDIVPIISNYDETIAGHYHFHLREQSGRQLQLVALFLPGFTIRCVPT
ncbi:hypothetical protein PRIPAC_71860, partial [Pristionchus pacificus]|uniref:Uncharacterized protein n=1 Tax=Pristionchus pacificus TaxID=54126 RepID=A0A2A6CES8_PRIPA